MAHDCQIFRGVFFSYSTGIFFEDYVKYPVYAVLDTPVAADSSGEFASALLRRCGDTRNIISFLDAYIEPTDAVVTASSHAAKSSRNLQLDILRGIAIVLVLIRHPVMRPDEAGSLSPVAKILHNFGWTGVDLFFVLSGFLIGGLLIKEIKNSSRLDVKRFIIRRGL